jgi:hypothetical protein
MTTLSARRPGRPPKFGRPSEVVALTLPQEVVRGLRRVHPDLGWAIVTLFEKGTAGPGGVAVERQPPDAELVSIAGRNSLIVINRAVFSSLPGVEIIPLDGDRAFLALDPGRGMSELELAVVDRLDDEAVPPRERKALRGLRTRLREWRLDPSLRFHSRAIIVVEEVHARRRHGRPPTTGE